MAEYKWGNNPYKEYPPRGINGTDIVENPDTSPLLIGRTIAWCNDIESAFNEATNKIDEYYNWLVRLGEIVPEKTAEEIAKETAEEQLRLANEQIAKQDERFEQQQLMLLEMMKKLESIGGVSNGIDENVKHDTESSTKLDVENKRRPNTNTRSTK